MSTAGPVQSPRLGLLLSLAAATALTPAWTGAAEEATDTSAFIVPLPDHEREAVIEPDEAKLAAVGLRLKDLRQRCLSRIFHDNIAPADVLAKYERKSLAWSTKPPKKTLVPAVRLADVARVSVRPLTFVPLDELRPLFERMVRERGGDAMDELSAMAGRAKSVVPLIVPHIERAKTSERATDFRYLLRSMGPHAAEAVPALAKKVRSRDNMLARVCADMLASIGAPAVPALEELLIETRSWRVRMDAGRVLGKVSPEGRSALRRAATHKNPEVRKYAARGMGFSAEPEDLPVLLPMLRDRAVGVRERAAGALFMHGPAAKAAVDDLLTMLGERNYEARRSAIYALGAIGVDGPRVVKRLAEFLSLRPSEENDDLCRATLWAIKAFPAEALAILPDILACLDSRRYVKCAALELITSLGPKAASAAPRVGKLAVSKDFQVANGALQALAAMGSDASPAAGYVIKAFQGEGKGDRGKAVDALAAIGPAAREALPLFPPRLLGLGSVPRPPHYLAHAICAIDAEEAIRLIKQDMRKVKERGDGHRVHDMRRQTLEIVESIRNDAHMIRQHVAELRRAGGSSAPPKMIRCRANPNLTWPHGFAALRSGDPVERILALCWAPSEITASGMVYVVEQTGRDLKTKITCRVAVTLSAADGKLASIGLSREGKTVPEHQGTR